MDLSIGISLGVFRDSIIISQLYNRTFFFRPIPHHGYGVLKIIITIIVNINDYYLVRRIGLNNQESIQIKNKIAPHFVIRIISSSQKFHSISLNNGENRGKIGEEMGELGGERGEGRQRRQIGENRGNRGGKSGGMEKKKREKEEEEEKRRKRGE